MPLRLLLRPRHCPPLRITSIIENTFRGFLKTTDQFCSRILSSRRLPFRGEGEHFFRPIAAALHGRAAYHHDRLHEKSIIGLAPLTVRPFALTRSSPNLSTISWTGRQASCEWGKPNFEELGTCF